MFATAIATATPSRTMSAPGFGGVGPSAEELTGRWALHPTAGRIVHAFERPLEPVGARSGAGAGRVGARRRVRGRRIPVDVRVEVPVLVRRAPELFAVGVAPFLRARVTQRLDLRDLPLGVVVLFAHRQDRTTGEAYDLLRDGPEQ